MSHLQIFHKQIDEVYKTALIHDDVNELVNFLAENNFEGVNYVDGKIAEDLSDLTPEDEGKICSLLDILLKMNEAAGIFVSNSDEVQFEVNVSVIKQLFDIISDENISLNVLAKVLQIFTQFFSNQAIVNLIHSTQSFEGSIQILGRKLPLVGDYICQLQLCECLYILSSTGKYLPRIWFPDSAIRSPFLNITGSNFEEDARTALNCINRMEDNPKVFSYPVKSILFGTYELQKPGEDAFWVDFNYDSKSISFFFLYRDEPLWETARIKSQDVIRYMIKDNKEEENTQELIITLHCPCYQTVEDIAINPVTESNVLTIVFCSVQKIKDHIEKLYGSPYCDNPQNKQRSSVCSNVVAINKYIDFAFCSEFDEETKHIGRRKSSVCGNIVNLQANESKESSSTSCKRKSSSVIMHLQSKKVASTYIEDIELSNNVDDESIATSGQKKDFKPVFKKSSMSSVNMKVVEENYISVEQTNIDELEKCATIFLDKEKHVESSSPLPSAQEIAIEDKKNSLPDRLITAQELANEDEKNSLPDRLSVSSSSMKFNDNGSATTEKEMNVNLELEDCTLKTKNDISIASNQAPTSEEIPFYFEKYLPDRDGKHIHVEAENIENSNIALTSKDHLNDSQMDCSTPNKNSSQLLQHPSLSDNALFNSEITDTAISRNKRKNIKKSYVNVHRKSIEEITDSHSDNNMNQSTRKSALRARKKSKAMLDFIENSGDDEQNFDIQCQSYRSRPNCTVSSTKGPTINKKHRSIFHTDTETVSSGHSWLKNRKKLFEIPKRKYSDRKKTTKRIPNIPDQAAITKENSAHNIISCVGHKMNPKKKVSKEYKGNELVNKSSCRNWSDIEHNELFVEKVPSRSCLTKKFSTSYLSADSNTSTKHCMESAVLEHENCNKRLKYDSDVDFEQNEFNENFNMETKLQDSHAVNISRDVTSHVDERKKNVSSPNKVKKKKFFVAHLREENKDFHTPAREKGAAIPSRYEEIKENERNYDSLPQMGLSENRFGSEIQTANMPAKSSLGKFDVACDETNGKQMHLNYFLSSLTETSDVAENESGRDYKNNSKKRKSECFIATKERKKPKIDGKQKESKILKHDVSKVQSVPKNIVSGLNYYDKINTEHRLKVGKNRSQAPIDDLIALHSSPEIKSRNKECQVPSAHQTDMKEQKMLFNAPRKFHSKKTEPRNDEFERNLAPDIGNLTTKAFKRSNFSSSCSDHKHLTKMETMFSVLSKLANSYARKLIATFQSSSHEYYLRAANMRQRIIVCSSECVSKANECVPAKDLNKMIKKCEFIRKKVESSLRKLLYYGQEYFEFERKWRRRMENKNRIAGAKFCFALEVSSKNVSNTLEEKVLSKLNKVQRNFIHDINEL